jgi:PASTA domain
MTELEGKPRLSMKHVALLLATAAFVISLMGCGGDDSQEQAAPEVRTVERTVIKTVPAERTRAAQPSSAEKESSPDGAGKIRVPNVVGKDHQLAQDTMQAAGLYSLEEEDATGQGRLLLYDRNWTVVSQSPPPGALVGPSARITLRSKKDGE